MKIYKYEIPETDKFELELPLGSTLLDMQNQNGKMVAWVKIPDEQYKAKTIFKFYIVGTGHDFTIGAAMAKYFKTVQVGQFVLHIFIESEYKEPAQ